MASVERARAARVLGVDVTATPDQIRDAFRRRAREVHPDTVSGDAAAMIELNEAYDVLNARDGPGWQFGGAPVSDPSTVDPSTVDPEFDDLQFLQFDEDADGRGDSGLRWFGIALLVAASVITTIVFLTAVGYDWSLSG